MKTATADDYTAFLDRFNFESHENDLAHLELSAVFISTLPFCSGVIDDESNDEAIVLAQMFVAYAMSSEGFNPAAVASGTNLIKKGLGRNAIVKEWELDSELIGNDPMSMLKRIAMAHGAIKHLLCPDSGSGGISNFELIR